MKPLFRRTKIRTQLLASFLFVTLVTLTILVIALTDMNDVANATEGLYNKVLLPLDYISQSTRLVDGAKTDGRSSLLDRDPHSRDATAGRILSDIAKVKELVQEFSHTIAKPEAWDPYYALVEELDVYAVRMTEFRSLLQTDLDERANLDEAYAFLDGTLSPISTKCLEYLTALNTIRISLGDDLMTAAASASKFAFTSMLIISVAGLLITIGWGFFFSIHMSRPILKGVEVMKKAAEGDFTVTLPSDYGAEIGQLYNAFNSLVHFNRQNIDTLTVSSATMRASAQNMLTISSQMADNSGGLNEQTSYVSSAAEEFSAGMTQSSLALSTASAHISAVASSIEEINATIGTVAAAAEQTSTRVEQSNMLVENIKNSISMASGSVSLVSNAFNNVAASVDEINKSINIVSDHCAAAMRRSSDADEKAKGTNLIIRQLEDASRQIGKIVNIISDIADQTNMLALNAAIEAAGAGEAGRGFMVVANEVKELARQTADATDEIADQIENMQKSMPTAVGSVSEIAEIINGLTGFMKSLAQEVTQQGKRSDQIAEESAAAAHRISEISTEIGRISDNAHSVTRTVIESSKGVNEIARSTAELVLGTQEIAMNSERASTNISEIDHATKEMTAGLSEISKNIQLIHTEAGSVQESAAQTTRASGELLDSANNLETFVSKYKMA